MSDRPVVRPVLGMMVCGEVSTGRIVAMSKEWCIYEVTPKSGKVHECAEPWDTIVVVIETPTQAVSAIVEGPPVPVAED